MGAIATQAYANPRYGPDGLALLRGGSSAEEVVERLTAADDEREQRQLGVVDATGGSATFTGSECMDWAGRPHRPVLCRAGEHPRRGGDRVGSRLDVRPRRRAGRSPSACSSASPPRRPPAATAAASSRPRCSSSSATAATPGSATCSSTCGSTTTSSRSPSWPGCYDIHALLFGKTPRAQWIEVDDELRAELVQRLHALGYDGGLEQALGDWAGTENLEERVDGVERIDPVVLAELRAR